MTPSPVFEKVAKFATLSASLGLPTCPDIMQRKIAIDNWIFEKAAAINARPLLETLLKTTAITVPVVGGAMLLANHVKDKAEEVTNQLLLKSMLGAVGLSALGLGTYQLGRYLNKQSSAPLISAGLFKALKKLAAIGAVDAILEGQEKYATLRQINRAYGVQIIADMLRD